MKEVRLNPLQYFKWALMKHMVPIYQITSDNSETHILQSILKLNA